VVTKKFAVIPARYASTRFPGKPLALLAGKPMIHHVWDRCREAGCFDAVIVATDDERIAAVARGFQAEVAMTSAGHVSGTDRVAEVALKREADVFVNVQGDEPMVPPEALRTLARAFDDPAVEMATLVRALRDDERENPNVVKAVKDAAGWALAFSRQPMPNAWGHVGLYGYRRTTLLRLATLPPTDDERAERLEQLRALGHGIGIFCGETPFAGQAVDVPEDVPRVEALLRRGGR
jgi:3-deoxy-manno-octulosonate cytidylyltransferase (CMP-KDO synthetase)